MPAYEVIGAKVRTYKKYMRFFCATEEEATKRAKEALDKFSPYPSGAKTHVQVYHVQQVEE